MRVLRAKAAAFWPQPCSITSSGRRSLLRTSAGRNSRKRRRPAGPIAWPGIQSPADTGRR
jgi:hypothetical protein